MATRPEAGAASGAPTKGALEVVLVPDGGTLTLEEAFPRHELARVMPLVRAWVAEMLGDLPVAPTDRDAGAGI